MIIVETGRQDRAHGLRQHDPRRLVAARQAKCGSGLVLALIDGQDATADDLGRERRSVQTEASTAAKNGVINCVVGQLAKVMSVKGTPSRIVS